MSPVVTAVDTQGTELGPVQVFSRETARAVKACLLTETDERGFFRS